MGLQYGHVGDFAVLQMLAHVQNLQTLQAGDYIEQF